MIPHAVEVYARSTQTDADVIHAARSGVPTGLVSIPVRYMHSPCCRLVALADLEAMRAACSSPSPAGSPPDQSFIR